jgi:orotidine-5'-phosphate decarboxylase
VTNPSAYAISKLCLALDVQSTAEALLLAERVGDAVGVLKVGLELFVREGPSVIERLQASMNGVEREIFLDLKLHDIPETVARAVSSAGSLGVRYLTVHASGAGPMLRAAVQSAPPGLRLLAVTVLTSFDQADLADVGVDAAPQAHALRLAKLARGSGIAGLVCSAHELRVLRQALGNDFALVVPGIRPVGAQTGDQKRVATPGSAIVDGASLLVVGRPIRDAEDPRAQALTIAREIDSALAASGGAS